MTRILFTIMIERRLSIHVSQYLKNKKTKVNFLLKDLKTIQLNKIKRTMRDKNMKSKHAT